MGEPQVDVHKVRLNMLSVNMFIEGAQAISFSR